VVLASDLHLPLSPRSRSVGSSSPDVTPVGQLDPANVERSRHMPPPAAGGWWAVLGLNQRPLACEASALPLS
jgi:hypothetical protein